MENKEMFVNVPLDRFQELIAIEAEAKALVHSVIYKDYVCKEDILCAIGTEEAMRELKRRREEGSEQKSKEGVD